MSTRPASDYRPAWSDRVRQVLSPAVLRRAVIAALVVGSLLILLNQGDLIFSGQISGRVIQKSLMTPIIPFCVTLLGAFLNSNPTVRAEDLRPGRAAIRRSLIIAVLVGVVIIAVNQGDLLLSGAVTTVLLLKIAITPCVPFCVSLYGAYLAYRKALAEPQNR